MNWLEYLVALLEDLSAAVAWNLLGQLQAGEYTVVEQVFRLPAVLELHVRVVQALVMHLEFFLTMSIEVCQYTCSTSCDFTAFLETVHSTVGTVSLLAQHEIVVKVLASVSNKERGAEQWTGGGTDFLDMWDLLRKFIVFKNVVGSPLLIGEVRRGDRVVGVGRGHLRCVRFCGLCLIPSSPRVPLPDRKRFYPSFLVSPIFVDCRGGEANRERGCKRKQTKE